MQVDETLSQGRLARLAKSPCVLGEPDIICIRQVKLSNTIFTQKKVEDYQENYINGLVFPSTAHFSSFISSRYKSKDPNKHQIKAKLYMFDAYSDKDLQIQISIPGSMEVKAFSLRGQPLVFNLIDYEKAYYSSFLRSLRPMNYPGIVLYPLMNRIEILKPIVKNLVSFSMQHQLRAMDYELDISQGKWYQQHEQVNLSLEILIDYCLQNKFTTLLKIVLQELRKLKSRRYLDLVIECKLIERKYKQVVHQTAQKLLMHSNANQLKEYQIKALFQLKRYNQVVFIGNSLIQSGGTNQTILGMILHSLIETGQDHRFLKTLNLVYNLHNFEETNWKQITHISDNNKRLELQKYVGKLKCLSEYPELSFPFDNTFLSRLASFQNSKALLSKNSKEGLTVTMIQRVDQSLRTDAPFYSSLIRYIKQKGWNSLVRHRAQCFWLESDFAQQQESIKNLNNSLSEDKYSFFEGEYDEKESAELQQQEFNLPSQLREEVESEPDLRASDSRNKQQFQDGNMSEQDYQKQRQMRMLPKCSAKVIHTARKINSNDRKIASKVQCNALLQQTFFSLFNDLKLQSSLENWQQKLSEAEINAFSPIKKEIAATILLKKGFLNRKLQQNKKCEQAFQKARSISSSLGVNIVATYQLILLYIDSKNVAGVEFYLVQLMKIMKTMGIDSFDIVPEWAKTILQFVIHEQGLGIIKNIHPVFKTVFGQYLRSNMTEEQLNLHLHINK